MELTIWIVTGSWGSGKTTFFLELARQARLAGFDVAGILSPAVFDRDLKVGIDAQDQRSGEVRALVRKWRQEEDDLVLGDWFFNRSAMEWGNRVFQSATPCDLLLVDELGPMEFDFSRGWIQALEALRSGPFRLAVVVVRPDLLEKAAGLLHPAEIVRLEKPDDGQAWIDRALAWLGDAGSPDHSGCPGLQ